MMHWAVTGVQEPPDQGTVVEHSIRLITRAGDELRTGAAHGVDTLAAETVLADPRLGLHLTIIVPAARHNEDIVRRANGRATILYAPRGTTFSDSYMVRNALMLDGTWMGNTAPRRADGLLAFPYTSDEIRRSGTWATVRRARVRGIPIYFFPLDGSAHWREG